MKKLTQDETKRYKYVFHFKGTFSPYWGYSDNLKQLEEMKKDKEIDHFYVYNQKTKETVYNQ